MLPRQSADPPVISEKRLRLGIHRLLASPLDLAPCGARVWPPRRGNTGSSRHRDLFESYLSDLGEVIPEARRVWHRVLEECRKTAEDETQAVRQAIAFAPAGAAFDARVVWVIRKYWLACDSLNAGVSDDERVSPQVFTLQWLIDVGYRDAVEVLAGMPYWPVGLDSDGNWT